MFLFLLAAQINYLKTFCMMFKDLVLLDFFILSRYLITVGCKYKSPGLFYFEFFYQKQSFAFKILFLSDCDLLYVKIQALNFQIDHNIIKFSGRCTLMNVLRPAASELHQLLIYYSTLALDFGQWLVQLYKWIIEILRTLLDFYE